jgi:parvulin-like peptidyl-prolyl isomerase
MRKSKSLLWLGLLTISILGCNRGGAPPSPSQVVTPSGEVPTTEEISKTAVLEEGRPSPSPTSPKPTATPEPSIASVNGLPITLNEYEAEMAMFAAAVERTPTQEDEQRVLDDLIDQAILADSAAQNGLAVDKTTLEERLDQVTENIGGPGKLAEWMQAYGFDEDTFRRALERSINAAQMRDEIAARVPDTAEQAHVRQVLFTDRVEAENALVGLEAGNIFDNLANEYDPITKGDLGWFPRGYVADAQLEEYAFSLEIGEYSPVFETPAGFHIIVVLEREPQRRLESEARLLLQIAELEKWLDEQRGKSDIEIFTP